MHCRCVGDVRANRLGSLEEERDGIALTHRRQVVFDLAGDSEWLATGRYEA